MDLTLADLAVSRDFELTITKAHPDLQDLQNLLEPSRAWHWHLA